MARLVSPVPPSFASDNEREYWQMSQDIAYRAGIAICEREGASWLITPAGEALLHRSTKAGTLWWQSWLLLKEQYPELSRLWVKGRAVTRGGGTEAE